MEENIKEKLRPLYSVLRGYLAQAPTPKETHDSVCEESVWNQYNGTVNLLSEISENDYSSFCIEPSRFTGTGRPYINIVAYKQKLGGLISGLHGEYFADEPNPLDGVPSTVITQTQQQNQSIMLLEIQSIIYEKLPNYPDGSKEKGFLGKLKSSLSSISNITQFLKQLFKLAKDSGLNADDLHKIFS